MMEKLEEYECYLKQHLSSKRFAHSVNVSIASAALAERFGGVDPEKARFAGLVHDICKEEPEDVQFTQMMRSSLDVCEQERKAFKVWHGIAGAEVLRDTFGVTDTDVLHAVRYHTVGRAGMSQLERIVYLADLISAERDYADVEMMRSRTEESLESGMYYALQMSLQKLIRRGALIPHHTVDAYNEYAALIQQKEG